MPCVAIAFRAFGRFVSPLTPSAVLCCNTGRVDLFAPRCTMKVLLLVTFLVVLLVDNSFASPLRIKRKPHVFTKEVHSGTRGGAGNSIKMKGGVLTLGAYFVDIQVGRPPKTFTVLVDTGSSNLVIPAQGCTTCGNGPVYSPSKSTTSTQFPCNQTTCQKCSPDGTGDCVFGSSYCYPSTQLCGFGISYGGGSSLLAGAWVYDEVCLGSICANATVGMAMAEYPSNSFDDVGILGLASPFNACNPTCVTTLFDSYVEQQLVSNLYGMCITPSNGGILDMGEIVSSRYKGTLQYVPQEVDRWFNIILVDILVGSTSLGLPPFAYATTNDVIGAFVDSGTSIVLFSPLIFQQLQGIFQNTYCKLPGVCGNETLFDGACFDSKTIQPYISQFPSINFVVRQTANTTVTFTMPPQSYIALMQKEYCLGIQAVPGIGAVLGDLFMENYYIVFDRANNQLGFAPLASCQ